LFHPAATSRVSCWCRPGDSPDPQRFPAHRRALPPCRWPVRAHRRPGCHARGPRLRGVVLWGEAFGRVGGWPSRPSLPSAACPPSGARFTTVSPVPRAIRS
jgi:hypothetical protein